MICVEIVCVIYQNIKILRRSTLLVRYILRMKFMAKDYQEIFLTHFESIIFSLANLLLQYGSMRLEIARC